MQYYDYDQDAIFIPFGVEVRHTWHEIGVIFHVIERHDVDFVVEIGTYRGGMTMMLHARSLIIPDFDYVTVEIDPDEIDSEIRHVIWGKLLRADCLEDMTKKTIEMLRNQKHSNKKMLIYCDNGKKARVFSFYKDILKSGDIIMTHDYWDEESEVYGLPLMGIKGVLLPEVVPDDLEDFHMKDYAPLHPVTVAGTRITGFIKL